MDEFSETGPVDALTTIDGGSAQEMTPSFAEQNYQKKRNWFVVVSLLIVGIGAVVGAGWHYRHPLTRWMQSEEQTYIGHPASWTPIMQSHYSYRPVRALGTYRGTTFWLVDATIHNPTNQPLTLNGYQISVGVAGEAPQFSSIDSAAPGETQAWATLLKSSLLTPLPTEFVRGADVPSLPVFPEAGPGALHVASHATASGVMIVPVPQGHHTAKFADYVSSPNTSFNATSLPIGQMTLP